LIDWLLELDLILYGYLVTVPDYVFRNMPLAGLNPPTADEITFIPAALFPPEVAAPP